MIGFLSSKKSIAKSGLLQGYTDYHCHLLPGVDDGVKKPETTQKILQLMHEQGVKEIWFTPHIMEEIPNTPEGLKKKLAELPNHGLPLQINLSAENMLDSHFSLEQAVKLPLPGNHILVETSYFTPPFNLEGLLTDILKSGVYPLLAHPCRYMYMGLHDYEKLHSLGIHFQLNLPAIAGAYGPDVCKRAEWLLAHGFYTFTGTDTHSLTSYQEFLEAKLPRKIISQLEDLLHD